MPDDPRLQRERGLGLAVAKGFLDAMGGTIDGALGDHVIVAPPYIATTADIDTIVERLGDAVDAAISSV